MFAFIILLSNTLLSQSLEAWMHTIQLYGSDAFKGQPQIYQMKQLLNYVKKSVILEDGREITCHIPLDPSFRVSDDFQSKEKFNEQKLIEHINQQQAAQGLFPLTDQCAYHFTSEFIWEFCFKKYMRQFDDFQTMKNKNKNVFEEYFVGFANSYDKLANQTIGMYSASWHQISIEADSVLIVDGQIAKVRNYGSNIKPTYIEITVNNYEKIATQSSTEFLKLTKYKSDFRGYIIKLHILCFITNELFLLKEFAPFRIISSDFKLVNENKPNQKQLERDKIYLYKNYIFGSNLMSHSYFTKEQTIAIRLPNQDLIITKIILIIDGTMIEIQKPLNNEIQTISIILLEQHPENFTYLYFPLKLTIFTNIVFFSHRYFSLLGRDALAKNDGIMIFNESTSIIEAELYFIKSIYMDGIAVLQNYFTSNLNYQGEFIIRKSIKSASLPSYRDRNQAFIIASSNYENKFEEYQSFLISLTLNKNKYQPNYQRYSFQKYNPIAVGFSFKLQSLKEISYLLILKLYLPNQKNLEIVFLSHPKNQLIVREMNTRGIFQKMDPRFENATMSKWNFWIVLQDNYLYVGRGYHINQQNMMIRYKLLKNIEDLSNLEIEIDNSSYGLRIHDLKALKLEELTIQEIRNVNTQRIAYFTLLNFTLGDEQLKKTYKEHYTGGTYCPASNSSRQAEIKIDCLKDSLLQIIKINEPSTCSYKVHIGSWLLCADGYEEPKPIAQDGQQMICILNEK